MSSKLGLCQCDSNCKIEGESHLHGMDVWQCGCGLYCYAVEVKETIVSLFDWYEFRDFFFFFFFYKKINGNRICPCDFFFLFLKG